MRSLLRRIQALSPFGKHAPGHYHSPIPSRREISEGLRRLTDRRLPAEIDFNRGAQDALLAKYEAYFPQFPFGAQKRPGGRFSLSNDYFTYLDALFLYCFLREYRPKRIVEAGSGFSSALMLDTADLFPETRTELTMIEPHPGRLKKLLKPGDFSRGCLIEKKLQDADPSLFSALQAGDLLFVDSSHVSRFASDVNFLFFEIFPALAPGVFVHFHDIFENFDYPEAWLAKGRYWNEAYLLRAFLAHNRDWEVVFFNHEISRRHDERLRSLVPGLAGRGACSFYLKKK